ncbi:uncharacterized protein PHALS_02042 [Plasmopara halstedii]|uniref:Uncharacterized protein n=1 Tax=Plasmopara halstedii TaxID=4781 RepID=A0A0P1AX47_PLAHL|nr:uncharacterized protein PHALS_02042 [Plasmopara halstedii]CEG45768.1 hypothetical protein PHALS_02042 [Plasmopara halstedii]|eukprot:XP_024582137.1 hypothetical protein PHALS_02042 [Plasmopara halstedii]
MTPNILWLDLNMSHPSDLRALCLVAVPNNLEASPAHRNVERVDDTPTTESGRLVVLPKKAHCIWMTYDITSYRDLNKPINPYDVS